MDPEAAFLQQLQASSDANYLQSASSAQPMQTDDDDDEEDYDPSALIPESSYRSGDNATSYNPQPSQASPTDNTPAQPLTAASAHSPTQPYSRPTSAARNGQSESLTVPSKQPRTVGGFIVDDEDDEDETSLQRPSGAGANGLLGVARSTSTPQRSVSRTSNNNASSNVQISNDAQDQGVSDSVSNGASNALSAATVPTPNLSKQDSEEKAHQISAPVEASDPVPTIPSMSLPKARLPNDRVGILEDRIAEDPRGDLDAWLSLINEYRNRDKIEDARAVYDRFFEVFPTAAEQWVVYAQMELDNGNLSHAEKIFTRSLLNVPDVDLWSTYLGYIRRRNPLMTDTTGKARQTISQVYDFVLNTIGIDKDSGQIWQDYVEFIRSGPGQAGGTGWQDQQKMDLLRKAYQRAVCVPTEVVTKLWKEYDAFERGVNKTTGTKFIQERSAAYVTARGANIALSNITKGLKRTTLPTLPPRPGFDGEAEYLEQVEIWKRWINWEKDDPLVLKDEDVNAYKDRIVYVYKQALMALRFWPEMWYEAAEFCFQNGRDPKGEEFLSQGIAANPESSLLAFWQAERCELAPAESDAERARAVRVPYDKLLDTLYALHDKTKAREAQAITRLDQVSATDDKAYSPPAKDHDDDEYSKAQSEVTAREEAHKLQIAAVKKGYEAELLDLQRLISSAWIGLMRASRRIIGKGDPRDSAVPGGLRSTFLEARKRGRVLSDVYVASAHLEWQCYNDPTARKLFDRGIRLFKTDEYFALEYLKYLTATNDGLNLRAVFESAVHSLTDANLVHKTKPLFKYFHDYESRFGELSQIRKLEKRMADLFPEDPQLTTFTERFSTEKFNPIAYRVNISPATQSRPRLPNAVVNSIEGVQQSPKPLTTQLIRSPKRPLPSDESDSEQPRKFARGESPLKGAAGRRQQQQKRNQQRLDNIAENGGRHPLPPAPLPQQIMGLLNIIPAARHYDSIVFPPERVIDLLRSVDLSRARLDRGPAQPVSHTPQPMPQQMAPQMPPQMQQPMGYVPPNCKYRLAEVTQCV
ncbi:MAG: hypothetical protein Q9165_007320 [Trypethelium subeluteriae]